MNNGNVPAQPRLRVFAGPNGSGKSTVLDKIRQRLPPESVGVYVNADDIERELRQSGSLDLRPYELERTSSLLQQTLAAYLSDSKLLRQHKLEEISRQAEITPQMVLQLPKEQVNSYVAAVLADAIRRELLAQGSTFTFETVMSSEDKIRFVREARDRGYRTYLYFVATDDPTINIARVQQRVHQGGHDVPEDRIRSRYLRSIGLLDQACAVTNRAYIFDNSGEAHEWLVEISEGTEMTVHAPALPAWFTGTSLWQSFQPDSEPSATID